MIAVRFLAKVVGSFVVAAGLTLTVAPPPVAAVEFHAEDVVGGWVGELPCPFTSLTPGSGSTTTAAFECVSGTTWDGVWTGHTMYRVAGTLDVVSGDMHATIDETLIGLVAATQATGTLHLLGAVDVVGATGAAVVRERIVGGTGAFLRSSGTVEFDGTQVALAVGHGGYRGTWIHP